MEKSNSSQELKNMNKNDNSDELKTIGCILTKEEILENEKEFDKEYLENPFIYNDKKIKTIGDLRKIATTREIIESLEDKLDEVNYYYIYNWFLKKRYLINYN